MAHTFYFPLLCVPLYTFTLLPTYVYRHGHPNLTPTQYGVAPHKMTLLVEALILILMTLYFVFRLGDYIIRTDKYRIMMGLTVEEQNDLTVNRNEIK